MRQRVIRCNCSSSQLLVQEMPELTTNDLVAIVGTQVSAVSAHRGSGGALEALPQVVQGSLAQAEIC